MDRYELPEGWALKRLGEVSDISSGTTAPQDKKFFTDGQYPFVRTQDVGRYGRTTCLKETKDKVNEVAIKEKYLRLAKAGSIIFPKSGASILTNSRAILGVDAYIVSHLAIVEPKPAVINNEFLYYWLCTIDMAKISQSKSGYPSLRLKDLKYIEIPVPPLLEQRRIVAKIEQSEAKAEQLKQLQAETKAELEKFMPALLARAFRGEL